MATTSPRTSPSMRTAPPIADHVAVDDLALVDGRSGRRSGRCRCRGLSRDRRVVRSRRLRVWGRWRRRRVRNASTVGASPANSARRASLGQIRTAPARHRHRRRDANGVRRLTPADRRWRLDRRSPRSSGRPRRARADGAPHRRATAAHRTGVRRSSAARSGRGRALCRRLAPRPRPRRSPAAGDECVRVLFIGRTPLQTRAIAVTRRSRRRRPRPAPQSRQRPGVWRTRRRRPSPRWSAIVQASSPELMVAASQTAPFSIAVSRRTNSHAATGSAMYALAMVPATAMTPMPARRAVRIGGPSESRHQLIQ